MSKGNGKMSAVSFYFAAKTKRGVFLSLKEED